MMDSVNQKALKRVIIIGGGFGGLASAKALKRADVQVTLIDKHNFHLFQPLLYQVATGELSPANIASPLRAILRRQSNCEVLMAEVIDIKVDEKTVHLDDGQNLNYDYLIVATGAKHSYFGNDQWQPLAPALKTIEDATEVRKHLLYAFEQAEKTNDPIRREAWLTFVIVGGGPTGVELSGALSEIAHYTMRYDFRRIDPVDAKILLVEASEDPLDAYPKELTAKTKKALEKLKITLVNNSKVVEIFPDKVVIAHKDGGRKDVVTNTVIWAAGIAATPLARALGEHVGANVDRGGRVSVNADLTLDKHPEVMVLGDMCSFTHTEDGKPLPGLAAVAQQQGKYVGNRVAAIAAGQNFDKPFKYRDRGTMAVIGRYQAIVMVGKWRFSGFIAWLMWFFVHILLITQFRSRILIGFQWAFTFISRDRSARLITGEPPK